MGRLFRDDDPHGQRERDRVLDGRVGLVSRWRYSQLRLLDELGESPPSSRSLVVSLTLFFFRVSTSIATRLSTNLATGVFSTSSFPF
jgi:hypothetical protein